MRYKVPVSTVEWQEAVNAAHIMLCIADCVMYGLVETNMKIDIPRCDNIIKAGAQLGIHPESGLVEKTFGRKP